MKRRVIIHLGIIISLYLLLRIPLLGKVLWFDEIYNTFCYLQQRPFASFHSGPMIKEYPDWALDWKREIAYHPPFLNAFYYNWIRFYGDSEISLHVPTLIIGLIGIIMLYFFGLFVFNGDVSFIATLATVCSASHIAYSTQAVHAIFEIPFFLGSLLLLFKFIISKNQKTFRSLLILNLLSTIVFYHYFFFLIVQTAILFFLRKKLKVSMSYFVTVSLVVVLFLFFINLQYREGHYSMIFWYKNDLMRAIRIIAKLPYRFTQGPSIQLYYHIILPVLFILFVGGCIYVLLAVNKVKTTLALLRVFLIVFLLFPFLLYCLAGLIDIKFGWYRNFFYLLPIYYLIIFWLLRNVLSTKPYYIVTAVLLIILLSNGIKRTFSWDAVHPVRPILRCAANIKSDLVLFLYPPRQINIIAWTTEYYSRKYGVGNKVIYLCKSDVKKINNLFSEKIKQDRIFAIVDIVQDEALIIKDRYLLGENSADIVRTEQCKIEDGFQQFIENWVGIKSPIVVVYFCKSSGQHF